MKLARLLPFILLSPLAFGTAAVSGKLQNPDTTGAVPGYVQFDLQNCGLNVPTAAGSTISSQQKFTLASDGTWSGTLYRNDEILCNGISSTWWHKTYYVNFRQVGPAADYVCSQASCVFDGSSSGLTPLTVYPPSPSPLPPVSGSVLTAPLGPQTITGGFALNNSGPLAVTGATTLSSTLGVTGATTLSTLGVSGATTHTGSVAFNGSPAQFAIGTGLVREASSLPTTWTTLFSPGSYFHCDLTNLANNTKHCISMVGQSNVNNGSTNMNGIAIDWYTTSDAAFDNSGIWVRQTGGGNAISAFNLGDSRPGGYTLYANNGVTFEGQADNNKVVYWSQTTGTGSAINFKANLNSTNDTGYQCLPTADVSLTRRCYQVKNAAGSVENFYVDLSGNMFAAGQFQMKNNQPIVFTDSSGSTFNALIAQNDGNLTLNSTDAGGALRNIAGVLGHSSTSTFAFNGSVPVQLPISVKMSGGAILLSGTAPTISSGFGTSPSVASNNGAATFRINVGTGGSATAGVIGMPTANGAGWNCGIYNLTAHASNRADDTVMTASTNTTVSIQNQTKSTGAAVAWTASDVVVAQCEAY